jgi:hypothetical protein
MEYKDDELRRLAERFWSGESTLEEEKTLKELVSYSELPEEYQDLAAYFESMNEMSDELGLDSSFDENILEKIDAQEQSKIKRLPRNRMFWAAAAVLLLAFGLLFFQNQGEEQEVMANDATPQETYTEEELQAAFDQTQAALLLISSKMNRAGSHADQLNKFHSATTRIKTKQK